MPSKTSTVAAAIVLAMAFGASPTADAQKMYKWVDEDGSVYYSDQVPPDQVKQARERLNDQGVVIERTERAMTPEEKAAREAARAAEIAASKARQAQLEADRELLSTYASEADIFRVRDQQMSALDRSIEAAKSYVGGQRKSLATLLERAASNERQGRELSPALQSSILVSQEQIAEQQTFIEEKEAEKLEIAAWFDEELARYRDILARHGAMVVDRSESSPDTRER
jgi:hypothetical protein